MQHEEVAGDEEMTAPSNRNRFGASGAAEAHPGLRRNASIAGRLDELADLLERQDANPFRVAAYRRAADSLRGLETPVDRILEEQGIAGLDRLPGIGPILARSIFTLAATGRLPLLDRLRGETHPVDLLASVPGIGEKTADRLHHDMSISTLEDLETAAWDGRLARVPGIGPKRLSGVRDALAGRLGRIRSARPSPPSDEPSVAEIFDVDREYRERASNGTLPRIAPRRFNPERRAWLPILHTERGDRSYTALFSNTARAHALGRTGDWVVLYTDGGKGERPWTVVTETSGPLAGRRVVRGRESECRTVGETAAPPIVASEARR